MLLCEGPSFERYPKELDAQETLETGIGSGRWSIEDIIVALARLRRKLGSNQPSKGFDIYSAGRNPEPRVISHSGFILDLQLGRLDTPIVSGVKLGNRQASLVALILGNPKRVVTYDEMLSTPPFNPNDTIKKINMIVPGIRKKTQDDGWILNVYGEGYRFGY